MRNRRSHGLVTVTLAITLLALEAVTVLGVVGMASWWSGPRPAALARAGATTWHALTQSAQQALVSRTMPAALAAVRSTSDLVRVAQGMKPATDRGRTRSAAEVAIAPTHNVEHPVVRVRRARSKRDGSHVVHTGVNCAAKTRVRSTS